MFSGVSLDPSSQSVESWNTTKGGGYVAAGVGGGITGKGAHVLVIDDPVRTERTQNPVQSGCGLGLVYIYCVYTTAPGGGTIILTRWHDDLAGRLLQAAAAGADQWEVVKYPAIAEKDEEFREKGDALHPGYSSEALTQIQRAVGPRDWSALYQQNPVSDEGEYFNREMIRYYDENEVDFVDYASIAHGIWRLVKERNDYSVGVVVGVDEYENLYVVDCIRGKYDGFELVEQILDLFETWRPHVVGIEKGHIEMALGPFYKNVFESVDLMKLTLKI